MNENKLLWAGGKYWLAMWNDKRKFMIENASEMFDRGLTERWN